jgi:uncharacterized repeat protein (TIGR01451 family)
MFFRNPVAVHFDRDVGAFLRENCLADVTAYLGEIAHDVPLWWLTAGALSHGENAYATPEISWTVFMLHAYVLDTSVEELQEYLDAPDRMGDLLYIQKLVGVLEKQPNLSPSSKRASSVTPQTGETIRYTVTVRNSGRPFTDTVYLTDSIPSGLNYVPSTLAASSGVVDDTSLPSLYWQGALSDTAMVTVTYAARVVVPGDTVELLINTVAIESDQTDRIVRSSRVIANGEALYAPYVSRGSGP